MTGLHGKHAVVVGFGSIGQRHVNVLESLGVNVSVVSRRNVPHGSVFDTLEAALQCSADYIVIATETTRHADMLAGLALSGWNKTVLVEKPLFSTAAEAPDAAFPGTAYVGYNMRFLPLLQRVRTLIGEARILSVDAHCGQWLPDWRPSRDYRQTASASKASGGGVLRDLSHELDYVSWLTGPWKRVYAQGGHVSDLEIDVEDSMTLLVEAEQCSLVSISLNYLDRPAERRLTVTTTDGTITANFVTGTLAVNGTVSNAGSPEDMKKSYAAMHESVLLGEPTQACTFGEALDVVRLIDAAELSIRQGSPVFRGASD